jgi:hypothetical protein
MRAVGSQGRYWKEGNKEDTEGANDSRRATIRRLLTVAKWITMTTCRGATLSGGDNGDNGDN